MAERGKILFISVPIGSGHVRAAQAVGTAISELAPDVTVEFASLFDFFNQNLGSNIYKAYLKILEYMPQIYGHMYSWGNNSTLALTGQGIISKLLADNVLDYINTSKPSAIICTHATPAGMIAYLCKGEGLSVPTAAIITDFAVHRLWLYPEIDDYFIADEVMLESIETLGVELKLIHTLGIPVDAKFGLSVNDILVRRQLGFTAAKKTILVMGGGSGLLPMTDIINACDALAMPVQIIAITGKNHELYSELLELRTKLTSSDLQVFGFVDNVHELMAVSDILISKPGGMTSAEALARQLPMIVFHPIPGQEQANTTYLTKNDVACSVKSIQSLQVAVKELLSNEDRLRSMKQKAAAIGKPMAAHNIAKVILKRINY